MRSKVSLLLPVFHWALALLLHLGEAHGVSHHVRRSDVALERVRSVVAGLVLFIIVVVIVIVLSVDLTHIVIAVVLDRNVGLIHLLQVAAHVLAERAHLVCEEGLPLEQLVVVVILLQVDVLSPREEFQRNELGDNENDEAANTEGVGNDHLTFGQRSYLKQGGAELLVWSNEHHVVLQAHLEQEDQPEEVVVEQSSERVEVLLVNDSAVDLVEQVHDHESVEDESVKTHLVRWIILMVYNFFWIVFVKDVFIVTHSLSD